MQTSVNFYDGSIVQAIKDDSDEGGHQTSNEMLTCSFCHSICCSTLCPLTTNAGDSCKLIMSVVGLYDSLSASRTALQRGSSYRSDSSIHLPNTVPGRVFVCIADYHSGSHGHLRLDKGDRVTGWCLFISRHCASLTFGIAQI